MTVTPATATLCVPLAAAAWPWWGYPLALMGGLLALIVLMVASFLLAPRWSSRWLAWLLSRLLYRIRVHGLENIPREGGALLVCNHVTWVDGILLISTIPRHVRMIIYADYARGKLLGWLMWDNAAMPPPSNLPAPTPKRSTSAQIQACKRRKGGQTQEPEKTTTIHRERYRYDKSKCESVNRR